MINSRIAVSLSLCRRNICRNANNCYAFGVFIAPSLYPLAPARPPTLRSPQNIIDIASYCVDIPVGQQIDFVYELYVRHLQHFRQPISNHLVCICGLAIHHSSFTRNSEYLKCSIIRDWFLGRAQNRWLTCCVLD